MTTKQYVFELALAALVGFVVGTLLNGCGDVTRGGSLTNDDGARSGAAGGAVSVMGVAGMAGVAGADGAGDDGAVGGGGGAGRDAASGAGDGAHTGVGAIGGAAGAGAAGAAGSGIAGGGVGGGQVTCLDANAAGLAFNAPCAYDAAAGRRCYAACTLGVAQFVGCISGSSVNSCCWPSCADCP